MQHDHKRGKIKHNALAALVTSDVFRPKRVGSKAGKGSYKRKDKHRQDYRHVPSN